MRWAVTALLVVVLVAIVASELLSDPAQIYWRQHPMVATLGSGILFALLTALVIEQARDNQKSRTRAKPALLALNSYLFAADRATQALSQAIDTHVAQIAPSKEMPAELGRAVELKAIFDADPVWFQEFSRLAEEQTQVTAAVLVQTIGLVSQYPPLVYATDELDAIEDDLATLSLHAKAISSSDADDLLLWPPKTPEVKELSEILCRRYERYTTLFVNELAIGRTAHKKARPKLRLYWREKAKAWKLLEGIGEILEPENQG